MIYRKSVKDSLRTGQVTAEGSGHTRVWCHFIA